MQPQQEVSAFEDMIEINTNVKERRDSDASLPEVQFRYCFEVNRLIAHDSLQMLEGIKPVYDYVDP